MKITNSLRWFLVAFGFIGSLATYAQEPSLTLEQCWEMARKNYPLIKQKELLTRSLEYSISNAQSGNLPQVSIHGQVSYQSEVTRFPGPGVLVEPLSKDQYKIYAELNQNIYDGGVIKNQNAVQSAGALVEQQKLEVELYKIRERVNQIYFGVLLMDAQRSQLNLLRSDITSSLAKTESAVRNGTAFQTNVDMLQAELLKTDQRIIEINAGRKAYLAMLGYFINQPLTAQTVLVAPVGVEDARVAEIKRPELTLYQFQSDLLGAQYKSSTTRNVPKLGLFVQGGYGRPGLNMLKNEFEAYYLGGVRLSWSLGNFYNSKRDRELLDVNSQIVNTQKETFLFNTNLTLMQLDDEVQKLRELIRVDDEIIALRARIKNTAKAQYEHGVISTNDLLRELNAEENARQNLAVHQIQFMLAKYNYQTTSGN
jgi:outer membrane protein TolC